MGEFELIRRYFAGLTPEAADVALGIGDDAALLRVPAGHELVVSTDTLVAGRHFPLATAPADIGWKALAVNLSDLAAMGATARWFTLALTLPEADEAWTAGLASGMRELALRHRVALVGGDTTRGPLSITITAMGLVPAGQGLRRDGARAGDLVCVTGTLGDAALALRRLGRADQDPVEQALRLRLDRPTPRLDAGLALRGLASAALDLSDGLAGDLRHLCAASGVGAELDPAALPRSAAFEGLAAGLSAEECFALQAQGGDDYELCVCLPPESLAEARARLAPLALSEIGRITAEPGLRLRYPDGRTAVLAATGYSHF
ncbi:MAG: thiamine-phosphate kinase [Stagnimonas sp.]|nr:thiamine-phosphate kinase [Stagnimonas sp.]